MNYPSPLHPGDKIAIVSPAGKVNPEYVESARQLFLQEKFEVEIYPHTYGEFHQFSGTDQERAGDLQQALDDPTVKAILFSRGGYGSLRTLMHLDWQGFDLNPKWLIGFSDITVFHSCLSLKGVASIHGVMPAFFFENGLRTDSLDRLLDLLRGNSLNYSIEPNILNLPGTCHGELVGGNLSLLYSLRGTSLDLLYDGKVLFIEDISEFDYHLDRMMMNLKFGGALSRLAGIIVGYFTDTKIPASPFGKDAYGIIREAVKELNIPVIFGFQAGHELPNYPLIMGGEITMNVSDRSVEIWQILP
ncbi:MAG: LD-carboxypeptidase [Prolixibacteraceae bacterium]